MSRSGLLLEDWRCLELKIYCDTRQQKGKHENIDRWFERHGVEYEYRKLDFGDYMTDGSNISIDTKRNVQEVAGNCGKDHARFAREMERAREAGYRLVILVETPKYKQVSDIAGWTNRVCARCQKKRMGYCNPKQSIGCSAGHRKPMTGATLARIMKSMESNHGSKFEFCHPAHTARFICDLLGVPYDG